MNRVFDPNEPELMDRPQPVNEDLRGALVNLATLNRWFGGVRPVREFVASQVPEGGSARVLDLACGYADIPRALIAWARRSGRVLEIHAVDFSPATLEIARAASRDFPEITFEQADALHYDPGRTYELALNTLSLHHFTESDAVRLLKAVRTSATRGAYVTDLRRSKLGCVGLQLLTGLVLRNRITRADALTSMKAAFSMTEFKTLAADAGWEPRSCRALPHFRQEARWIATSNR